MQDIFYKIAKFVIYHKSHFYFLVEISYIHIRFGGINDTPNKSNIINCLSNIRYQILCIFQTAAKADQIGTDTGSI